ncbi:MAG: YfjI family protein [Pseudomonadota bacterium]
MTEHSGRDGGGYSQDPAVQQDLEQHCFSSPKPQTTPTPLLRPKDSAEPFPTEHLGALLPAASAVAELTSAPAALAAQSVLGAASLTAQALANVETLDGPKPLSLFFVSIAESGERNSACDRHALEGVRRFERTRQEKYAAAYGAFQNELAIYEAEKRKIFGASKDAAAQRADLAAFGPEPKCPAAPELLLTDPTIEGLLKHFEMAQHAIGIFSDEGGQFLAGHGVNSDNRIKTATALSTLWGGGAVNRTRAGTGPSMTFFDRRVTCHLMVQPRIAEQLLADPDLRDQGLLSRTLLAWPGSRIGQRLISPGRRRNHAVEIERLAALHRRITDLLELGLPEGPTKPLDLKTLRQSGTSRDLLGEFYNHVEQMPIDAGPLQDIRGFASKAVEQAARLAGILQIFADETADTVSEVSIPEQKRSIDRWNSPQRLGFVGRLGACAPM